MRSPWVPALSFALLCGCAPVPDAGVPVEEDLPCASDDDCALHNGTSPARSGLCSSRTFQVGSTGKDAVACGPMSNMTPNLPEPVMACFRGTCVPIRTTR